MRLVAASSGRQRRGRAVTLAARRTASDTMPPSACPPSPALPPSHCCSSRTTWGTARWWSTGACLAAAASWWVDCGGPPLACCLSSALGCNCSPCRAVGRRLLTPCCPRLSTSAHPPACSCAPRATRSCPTGAAMRRRTRVGLGGRQRQRCRRCLLLLLAPPLPGAPPPAPWRAPPHLPGACARVRSFIPAAENRHVKSIVRTECALESSTDPHHFIYRDNPECQPADSAHRWAPGPKTDAPLLARVALYHYAVKSIGGWGGVVGGH